MIRRIAVLAALLLCIVAATAQELPFRPVLAYSPEAQAVRIAAALRLEAERLLDEGQGEEARQRWLAAIESYRQAGYPPGEIELLFQIGVSYQRDAVSNPEAMIQSAQYVRQGMVAAGSFMNDVASRAEAVDRGPFEEPDRLLRSAAGLAASGNCGEAQPLFVEAGRSYAAAGSPLGELRSLTGRLRCLPEIEDPLAAMNLMTTLLDFQRLGEKLKGKVDAGHWMRYLRAIDDLASGRSLAAETALRSTLKKFEQLGDFVHAADAALDLGCLLQASGRPDEAGVSYQRAARWLTGLHGPDALWNRVAAEYNLTNLSASAVELPTSQRPSIEVVESEPAMESDPIETVAGLSPRARDRRRAAFLLGDGDRLDRAGQVKKARAKWLAAASAAERAGDASSRAEAYRRLAYSSISGRVTGDFGLEYMDYLVLAMTAQSEDVEPLLRKRWKGAAADLAAVDQAWSEVDALVRSGACDQVLPLLQQVRSRYRRLGFPFGELRCMLSRLRCFAKPESTPMAMMTLLEVMPLLDEVFANDPQKELEESAAALASEGKSSAAKALYNEALCRSEKAGDPDALASSLVGLARVQVNLRELADAETNLERALGLLPFVDPVSGEVRAAEAHEHLGAVRFAQGREAEANEEFERARELIQQAGDPAREVVSLQRLAMQLGGVDSVRALSILAEAEALASRLPENSEVTGDLCMIRGMTLFMQGNLQPALGTLFDAEKAYSEVDSPFRHGLALNLISSLKAFLGRSGEATRSTAAMDRSPESGFIKNAQSLRRLWVLVQADRFEEAAVLARENVAFWQEVSDHGAEGLSRALLAICQIGLGDRAGAEREVEAATALVNPTSAGETSSPMQGLAATLIGLIKIKLKAEEISGTARREAGEEGQLDSRRDQQLRADLGRAIQAQLEFLQSAQGPLSLSDIGTGGLGSIERLIAGDPAGALESIGRSISSIERLGRSLTVSELRAPFYDRLSRLFDVGVDVSLFAGRPDEAFRRAEEARARAFIDQLGNQRVDPGRRGDAKLVERERQLRFQLADRQKRLREERGKALDIQSVDQLEALQRSVEQVQREWEEILIQLKTTNPDYAALVTVAPLTLEEVQTCALDGETSLVEYYVSGSSGGRVLAWAIDRESFVMVQLPMTAGELKNRVAELRDRIAARQPVEVQLAELYRLVFAPLAPHVRHRNLVIVPHGILHFLPFAALRQGKRYLGDAYVLSYAPSATALKLARQKTAAAAGPMLALGNPDGTLLHAGAEAWAAARLYGAEPLLGGAASEGAVVARAGQAGILHLAAHALLNPLNPLFTRIELAPDRAHDGNLEMHEVFGLDLSRTGLVVLSGCRTQLGELSAGDEIEGLTRAFLYAGTPAVVSSLWDVEDDSTAFLMKRFYAHLRRGAGRAEALCRAQRETRRLFPHPYHWAAFVLTGDGR